MSVERFCTEDIPAFLRLAAAEQWISLPWEFEFLLAGFPHGCLCLRDEAGKAIAFVTSLKHENSAWIGNLIVADIYRGNGLGKRLLLAAMNAAADAGAETIWLTASKMGKSMYEKQGFRSIDTIARWSGNGQKQQPGHHTAADSVPLATMCRIDSSTWGDTRLGLLKAVAGRGGAVGNESGFAVVQPCGEGRQIGPFSAFNGDTAGKLLKAALRTIDAGTKVYVDAPVSNRSALRIFNHNGLCITGINKLMYAGKMPDYQPEMLYGLATMGSCG